MQKSHEIELDAGGKKITVVMATQAIEALAGAFYDDRLGDFVRAYQSEIEKLVIQKITMNGLPRNGRIALREEDVRQQPAPGQRASSGI